MDERLHLDFHKRDTNDIRLNRVANAEIDSDGNVRARERRTKDGIEYFLARLFTSVFPNAIRRQRNGAARRRDRSFFYSCRRARATHLRGEKRVARPPGISSDILFMKHLIYTGA